MKQFLFVVPLVELNICVCACARVYASAWHRRDTHYTRRAKKDEWNRERSEGQRDRDEFIYTSLSKLIFVICSVHTECLFIRWFVHSCSFISLLAYLLVRSFVRLYTVFIFEDDVYTGFETHYRAPLTTTANTFFVCICICKFKIFAHLVQHTHKTSMCKYHTLH